MRRGTRRAGIALAGTLFVSLTACTEETLTGVDPGGAPGQGAETVEIEILASDLPAWRDTTYTGYALPSTSGIRLLANQSDVTARVLGRFTTIPDSVVVEEDRFEIERFENARLRLIIDTLASVLPETGAPVAAWSLGKGFSSREASWTEAAAGDPWTTPGGDLDVSLGTLVVDDPSADTVFLPLTVDADSLLRAWRAADGGTGFGLVAQVGGSRLELGVPVLVFDAKPVGRDTLIETLRTASPSTFIFEPQAPPPAGAMRIGTLPAARSYMTFQLPESVDGLELRGARVNRATLVLTSIGEPPSPFATSDTLLALGSDLLSNPFTFGPKTPIGGATGPAAELVPEELAAGGEIELPLDSLVQAWAAGDPAEQTELNVGVRILPEGGGLVYWEFATAEDAARQPRIRMLVTPSTAFDLP